jgi:hypothetical protein
MGIFGIAALLALSATGGAAAAQDPASDPDRQASFVRLSGDGLTAGQPGLHAYASFRFGMSRAEATRSIADLSGGVSATGVSRACGARPLAFARFGTLRLYFRNRRFVGWSLAGPRARRPFQSEWGMGIGTPRREIDSGEGEPVFRRTARGTEFEGDGMHGLLTGRGDRARVSALWAGVTCRGRQ